MLTCHINIMNKNWRISMTQLFLWKKDSLSLLCIICFFIQHQKLRDSLRHLLYTKYVWSISSMEWWNILALVGWGLTVIIRLIPVLNWTCTELANWNWAWSWIIRINMCSLYQIVIVFMVWPCIPWKIFILFQKCWSILLAK